MAQAAGNDEGGVLTAALVQLSLEGFEVGTRARVTVMLDWDTPGGVGDYDLNVNGANDFSVDQPEVETFTIGHCDALNIQTEVFIGLPVDTLTLTAAALQQHRRCCRCLADRCKVPAARSFRSLPQPASRPHRRVLAMIYHH